MIKEIGDLGIDERKLIIIKQSLYQYNLIKHNYFEVVLAEKKKKYGTTDYPLVDSLILYVRKNIDLVENHLDELSRYWMHGYAYYFMARALDNNYPEQNDSILLYLDKALDMLELEWFSRTNEANAAKEMQAGVGIIRAKALARKGKWQEAYKTMTGVLPLSIVQIVSDSIIEKDIKKTYLERLAKLDHKLFESIYQNTNVKITGMDMKYIICFAIDMDGKDISLIFNVEPASVITVRYRIRKKCAKENLQLAVL